MNLILKITVKHSQKIIKAISLKKTLSMKAFTFDLTNNGFIKYQQTFANNRMQYFIVRVDKILCLNYLGNKPVSWLGNFKM